MTGGGFHRETIVVVAVFVVGAGVYATGVWVEACSSDAYACMPSSDDMDLSGIVSPPSDTIGPFPVLADV